MDGHSAISELPQEVVLLIFSYLSGAADGAADTCNLGATSHRMRGLYREEFLWEAHFLKRWGERSIQRCDESWYASCSSRYVLEADAQRCVEILTNRSHGQDTEKRRAAWKQLCTAGEEALVPELSDVGPQRLVSFFKFRALDATDRQELLDEFRALLVRVGARGSVYVASEGVNGQLSVPVCNLEELQGLSAVPAARLPAQALGAIVAKIRRDQKQLPEVPRLAPAADHGEGPLQSRQDVGRIVLLDHGICEHLRLFRTKCFD